MFSSLTQLSAYAHPYATSSTKETLSKASQTQDNLLKQQEILKNHLQLIQKQKTLAVQKARKDQQRTSQLNHYMVRSTEKLQTIEGHINQLDGKLDQLQRQISRLNTQLTLESRNFSQFIPLMERLSLYPSDTLLTAPMHSSRPTIGLSIIQNISRQLEQKATLIQQHQLELKQLHNNFSQQITHLTDLQKQQKSEQAQLGKALKTARIAQQASSRTVFEISQTAEDAAKKAKNINEAIQQIHLAKLKAEKQLKEEMRQARKTHNLAQMQAAKTKSRMIASANTGKGLNPENTSHANAPVIGPVISLWGSHSETGPAQGITYAPPSQATVRAPCTGLIEFAGPFRSFGHMIILNCGKKYRFVLAGMAGLTVSIGQNIQKGIMVGKMGSWSGTGTVGRPTLFVQLKHGDRTINPSPFL